MKAAIIMGSQSDYPVLERAEKIFSEFEVEYETRILSAHRTPRAVEEFARTAEEKGFEVILAAAGKAAHLAGVIAANTLLPVIGIPVKSSTLDGLDSLLSTVQMPKGVPVATVAIDGSENAALLAIQMMGIKEPGLRRKIKEYKEQMEREILATDAKFREKEQEVKR